MLRTVVFLGALVQAASGPTVTLASQPLRFGAFAARFDAAGAFAIEGAGWPPFEGTWKLRRRRASSCGALGAEGMRDSRRAIASTPRTATSRSTLIADDCQTRRMILDRSAWRPGVRNRRRPAADDRGDAAPARPPAKPFAPAAGSWPSFRGREASGVADGQNLPDTLERRRPARTSCGGRRFPGSRTRARSSGATRSS